MRNKETAEELNRYFASIFTEQSTSNIPEHQESQDAKVIVVAITKEKILGKLKGLKMDKSPGPDGLHRRVQKKIAEEIMEALVVIFQESLESGRVPEDWKMANVTHLFKKGQKLKTGSYRPVSLTSVADKILESIIKMRLWNIWMYM
eukprot:g19472.t1